MYLISINSYEYVLWKVKFNSRKYKSFVILFSEVFALAFDTI